jgi:hypothetical protein
MLCDVFVHATEAMLAVLQMYCVTQELNSERLHGKAATMTSVMANVNEHRRFHNSTIYS